MRKTVSIFGGKPLSGWLAALVLFLIAEALLQPIFSQQPHPEASTARIHELAGMLAKQPSGLGRPCSDRAAWSPSAAKLNSFTEEAQQVTETPLPLFDEKAYLQFTRTGDRQPMEQNLHHRMDQLVPLVLAECAEYQGRYLPRIAAVMDSLAAMPSWTLSAHDPLLLNLHGVRFFVDLNAADLADNLADALYLMGNKIPVATRTHVLKEMERHVFEPMRQSFAKGTSASDHNGNWWLDADMNWNAVCLKGVTGAALAVLPSVEDRALFVAAAEHSIQHYEAGFNPDGYETEGLGYWNYGFSHFVELRENLLRVTHGKIDLLANPKMQKVALFGVEFPMMPGNAAAFGDAGVMPRADAHLIRVVDHIFQISSSDPGAKERSVGIQHVGLTSIALDLFPITGDELPTPPEVRHHELQTYYADSGVLVSRPAPGQDLAVTIKAGGNTTHSHNDIGSFVIGLDGVQPVGDPGGPRYYTGATFGPHRLDSELLNSFGHPVPEVDGHLQLDATKVKAKVLSHSFSSREDRIVIDMTPAYDVVELKQMKRTLVHSRDGDGMVEITDEFHFTKPAVVIESLPTHGIWHKVDDHTLLFTLGGKQLRVTIQAPKPVSFTETKVDDYGNAFTRVAAQVAVEGSSKISMRFTPETP
jgi:hypothetical protein